MQGADQLSGYLLKCPVHEKLLLSIGLMTKKANDSPKYGSLRWNSLVYLGKSLKVSGKANTLQYLYVTLDGTQRTC